MPQNHLSLSTLRSGMFSSQEQTVKLLWKNNQIVLSNIQAKGQNTENRTIFCIL